jgi:uncharacterized protein (TIRG00374 family)
MINGSQPVSPIKKLTEPKTIISFVVAIFVLYLLFSRIEFDTIFGVIIQARISYILFAAAIFFSTLPIRGERWRLLLKNIGVKAGLRDASEIFMLSWFANSIIPAKMGDVYRGYLARKSWGVPISKCFGTVYVERIYDVLTLVILMGMSSIMIFGTNSPREIRIAIALGFSIVVILISIIIAFSKGKMFVSSKLPMKVRQIFINFTEGLQESVKKGSISLIIFYTILIWIMETARLYLVVESLSPIHNMGISLSLIVFVALAASLLSAFPATPGGLGAVEFAIVGVFVLVGVDPGVSAGIAILDRAISYWGLMIVGGVVYLFSKKK